jgi:hypothetical protein
MTESLIRYLLTIACIGIINWLIYAFFEWGPRFMGVGLIICLTFLLGQRGWEQVKKPKVKQG